MALTFGTLLSSQGADALVLRPFRPSFEAVSPLYTVLRSSKPRGVRPAVDQAGGPVRSRSVQGEQYTTHRAPCRGPRGARPLVDDLPPGHRRRSGDSWADPRGHRNRRGPPRPAPRRTGAPRHGAGGWVPATWATAFPACGIDRRASRSCSSAPLGSAAPLRRHLGDGTARSPGGRRASRSWGCSAPTCAGRSRP